jgi:predicted GH43/DUF377 family glycosyl hydrolase
MTEYADDRIVLSRSPLRRSVTEETYVLGAFNPGLTRLASGNLLMMVRVAEALREPLRGDQIAVLRWSGRECRVDLHARGGADERDPRAIQLGGEQAGGIVLTSLSWLLPVELSPDGSRTVQVHHDKAIVPERSYQAYGVEDPRISRIGDTWYMTTCSVSAERQCTTLYVSQNGLDYRLVGVVLDHQNKDMLIFEGMVGGSYLALTRPMGGAYVAYPPASCFMPGPSIQLATSPDMHHWKPMEGPGIRPRRGSRGALKVGGGAPPVLTPRGWLVLYHGVEKQGQIGVYRTFRALLERDEPGRILDLDDVNPVLEARPAISPHLDHLRYVKDVVFTTGMVVDGGEYLVASGEDDLACRLTRIPYAALH